MDVAASTTNAGRGFVVRHCRLSDTKRISDLLKASWHFTYDPIVGESLALEMGRKAYSKVYWGVSLALSSVWLTRATTLLLAMHGDMAVGLATAQQDGAEVVLYALYVHPQWKRRGIGSALLAAVIARHRHAKAIRLEVLKDNAEAIAWYTSKGFEAYGETRNATGMPGVAALYMDRQLKPAH